VRRRPTKPTFDQLEGRSLLAPVLLVDCDTGAIPIQRWDGLSLNNYLASGWNWVTNQPSVNLDLQGPGGHGSEMAAHYAATMQRWGYPATVIPMVCAYDSAGDISDTAVGAALQWAAAAQRGNPQLQVVVSMPIQGNYLSLPESQGVTACALAGVPISVAAGNHSLNLDARYTIEYPADFGRSSPNVLVCAAANDDGSLRSYSNYGRNTVAVAAKSSSDDGYGHLYDLGTSGATMTGAARMASIMEVAPYRSGSRQQYGSWVVRAAEASAQYVQADAGQVRYGLI
jgi:hypothetical protein